MASNWDLIVVIKNTISLVEKNHVVRILIPASKRGEFLMRLLLTAWHATE
jgi:hypothetical protein